MTLDPKMLPSQVITRGTRCMLCGDPIEDGDRIIGTFGTPPAHSDCVQPRDAWVR